MWELPKCSLLIKHYIVFFISQPSLPISDIRSCIVAAHQLWMRKPLLWPSSVMQTWEWLMAVGDLGWVHIWLSQIFRRICPSCLVYKSCICAKLFSKACARDTLGFIEINKWVTAIDSSNSTLLSGWTGLVDLLLKELVNLLGWAT